ncbi:tetraspanin-18-like isoform X2 [Dreissena polymorpha]|uniref:tetraspanin-18-like isoform X2 n=1 Tax=Dreissena polymorpha TaxID=45954 RepID=UPI0022641782|nr:tetraspanin-18-like isoform X2 [Dreissena polymorpha]
MGSITSCGTTLIVLINTLFGLIGLVCLAGGVVVKFKADLIDKATEPIMGLVKGQLKIPEQLGVDIEYAAMLSAIILGEVAFVVIVTNKRSMIDDGIKSSLKESISDFYEGDKSMSALSLGWNALMALLKCCGVDGATDFRNTSNWEHMLNVSEGQGQVTCRLEAPVLCCADPSGFKTIPNTNNRPAGQIAECPGCDYNQGCYDSIWDLIYQHQKIAIGALAGIGAFQLILLILTICIIKDLSPNKVGP